MRLSLELGTGGLLSHYSLCLGNDRAFYIRLKRMVELFLLASGNYGKAPRFEDRCYNIGVL